MIASAVRRHLRTTGLVLLVLSVVALATVWIQSPSAAQSEDDNLLDIGASTYGRACALCHGENGRGLEAEGPAGGPSLIGVGAASVDFHLRTGRMPLTDQNDPLERREPQYPDTTIEGLVAYVTSLSDEPGPAIPDVSGIEDADLSRGLDLYTSNCAACHGPTAAGIAVGQRAISSTLDVASPVEIAEAIRIGPGVMPRFSEDVVSDEDLVAISAWVVDLRDRAAPGGLSIGRSGPVSEGMIAWVVGLGMLGLVMYLLGEKSTGELVPDEVEEGGDDGD